MSENDSPSLVNLLRAVNVSTAKGRSWLPAFPRYYKRFERSDVWNKIGKLQKTPLLHKINKGKRMWDGLLPLEVHSQDFVLSV